MKKQILLFFLIILSCQFLFAQKVIGYLPYYRTLSENFDYSKFTHIHYFTIWPGKNGEFIYPANLDSTSMAQQYLSIASKARQNNVKMIMTFGGTSDYGSKYFIEMASNDSTRNNFIGNVLERCKAWEIDGIDIDWEWSQHTDTETSNYAFTNLIKDLRKMTNENGLSLSIDVSASSWNGKYYNPEAVKTVDYVNIMTYTYNGSWSATTAHHSSMDQIKSTGIPYWINQGIHASKLNIGTAFFGQSYTGTYNPNTEFTSVSAITFSSIQTLISGGYKVVENNTTGSYCYSEIDNRIIFYDSPENVAEKMIFAKENNYAGVIIWEIGQDDSSQTLASSIFNAKDNFTTISEKYKSHFPFILRQENNTLKIEGIKNEFTLNIFSLNGTKLFHQKNCASNSIDISNLIPGIYLINIQINKKVYNRKIIIWYFR